MKDLHWKLPKIAEIRKDLNKWRNILCLWVKRYNIVKKSVLHNFIYKFSTISIKISAEICRNWQSDSKIYMEIQRTQISQNNIEGELILPDSRFNINSLIVSSGHQRDSVIHVHISIKISFQITGLLTETQQSPHVAFSCNVSLASSVTAPQPPLLISHRFLGETRSFVL